MNTKINCLYLGKPDMEEPTEQRTKHMNNCRRCYLWFSLRFLVFEKGIFWIDDKGYLCVKYKQRTYHNPLSKKVFEEVGQDVNKLGETKSELLEQAIDFVLLSLSVKNETKITKKDWEYLSTIHNKKKHG